MAFPLSNSANKVFVHHDVGFLEGRHDLSDVDLEEKWASLENGLFLAC